MTNNNSHIQNLFFSIVDRLIWHSFRIPEDALLFLYNVRRFHPATDASTLL